MTDKSYSCTKCKKILPLTEEYFFSNLIRLCERNPNKRVVGQCKVCANLYAKNYREVLKLKKLTRKNTAPKYREHGLLYIIGTTPNNPVKIGITTGNNIAKRLSGLQTSHWLDLNVFYVSPVLQGINKVEKELHEKFSANHIRGEWYDISGENLNSLVEDLRKKFSIP
jgi:hypothetical protein